MLVELSLSMSSIAVGDAVKAFYDPHTDGCTHVYVCVFVI